MNIADSVTSTAGAAEDPLRAGLIRANRALRSIPVVLRHLAGNPEPVLFSESVVAHTRAMIRALSMEVIRKAGDEPIGEAPLYAALAQNEELLSYCHALAVEGQVAAAGEASQGLDPVLSSMLQDLIGSPDGENSALAMTLLAAQARFIQRHRRMDAALEDLPADLFDAVLREFVATAGSGGVQAAERLREDYDESRCRTALLTQVLLGAEGALMAAVDPVRAGAALFASAVSLLTGVDRSLVVLALVDGQQPRLALLLAAAGLEGQAIEDAMLRFHPDGALSRPAAGLGPELALRLLAEGARR